MNYIHLVRNSFLSMMTAGIVRKKNEIKLLTILLLLRNEKLNYQMRKLYAEMSENPLSQIRHKNKNGEKCK